MVAEAGFFDAPFDEPISSSLQLVVNEQPEEVLRSEALSSSLLSAHGERFGHAAQAELA
jgi:hypothetical protein